MIRTMALGRAKQSVKPELMGKLGPKDNTEFLSSLGLSDKAIKTVQWLLGENYNVASHLRSFTKDQEVATVRTKFGMVHLTVKEGKAYLHKLSSNYFNIVQVDEDGKFSVSLVPSAREKISKEGFKKVATREVFSSDSDAALSKIRYVLNKYNFVPKGTRGIPILGLNPKIFIHRPIAKLLGVDRVGLNVVYWAHTPSGLSIILGAHYPSNGVSAVLYEFFVKSKELTGGKMVAINRYLESKENPLERAYLNLEIANLLRYLMEK